MTLPGGVVCAGKETVQKLQNPFPVQQLEVPAMQRHHTGTAQIEHRTQILNHKAGFRIRIRIRINLSCWIRIRIQIADPDPDPGGAKMTHKNRKRYRIFMF